MSETLEERLRWRADNYPDEQTKVYPSDVVELLDARDAELERLRDALRWRSVDDELPDLGAEVWARNDSWEGSVFYQQAGDLVGATHWLPIVPMEDDDE